MTPNERARASEARKSVAGFSRTSVMLTPEAQASVRRLRSLKAETFGEMVNRLLNEENARIPNLAVD